MFKTVLQMIARIKPTTKHLQVINKDVKFNLYSYESVDNKYKCIYIKK